MDETGGTVQHTASLSPTWQILQASIQGAPALRGEQERDEVVRDKGMMLRIGGVGVGRAPVPTSGVGGDLEKGGRGVDIEGDEMRGLIADFERRMEVLRRVVESAGRDGGGEKGEEGGSE